MVYLFTSVYNESDSTRNEELSKCFKRNLECDAISYIHLLLENITKIPIDHIKVNCRHIKTRPIYSDFFKWADELNISDPDLTVIANSDIYFDNSLLVLSQALKPNQCAALSRWDTTPSDAPVLFDRNDSQDVWVFRGPLKKIQGDFPVGMPRCDNRVLYELKKAGYEVINPAFSVRAYHLHSGIRQEYSGEKLEHFVGPPYAYLWPHNLWSLTRTVLYNLCRHPDAHLSWRFDRRKFDGSLPVRTVMKVWRMVNET